MKIFDVNLDSEKIIVYLTYNLDLHKKYIVTISDLDIDCLYYSWTVDVSTKGSVLWIQPFLNRLTDIIKTNKKFSGLSVKIYTEQRRLMQSSELIFNKNVPRFPYSVQFDPFDLVGYSYLDFFYGDICNNMDFSGTVVDAGANVGFFSMYAKQHGAKRIYSIDPDPSAFYYLRKNLGNFNEIILLNKAVTFDDNGCTINIRSGGTVGTGEIPHSSDEFSWNSPSISVNSLLKIEQDINLLKLDIEGSEFKVIEALNPEHFKNINQLFIEFHSNSIPIVKKLKNVGYNIEYRYSTENDDVGFIYAKKIK